MWKRIEDIRTLRRYLAGKSNKSNDAELEAVVQRELTWPDSKASVCFMDGRKEARDHVAEVALRWTQSTGLSFEFGPAGNRDTCAAARPANIRVSFVGSGYWSYVGIEAKQVDAKKQTLNLQGMNKTTFTAEDDGITCTSRPRHRLRARTSKPGVGVREGVRLGLPLPGDGLEPAAGRRQHAAAAALDKLLTTAFDAQSIMMYSLDRDPSKTRRRPSASWPSPTTPSPSSTARRRRPSIR